ncbi:MAG: hypothetical protein ACFCGT_13175, partial [Sandaracinaceae bacterium]
MSRTFGPDLRIATESRAFGTTLTFTRDAAGRVTQRDGSDGSQRTYTYGPQDRVETYTDATGSTTQRFDAAGRLDGIDYPTAAVFEQDWDVMDRVERVRVTDHAATPTTRESTFAYDAGGNLETVTDPFGRVTTTTYAALDRPVLVVRPNGVETATVYDDRGWVESMTHTDASGAVLASVTYVRSDSGEPTRVTREDGSYVEVAYDAALRVERESYYDLAGTLVEQIDYTYDRDGNRTSRTTSAGTETYVYTSGARLDFIERG